MCRRVWQDASARGLGNEGEIGRGLDGKATGSVRLLQVHMILSVVGSRPWTPGPGQATSRSLLFRGRNELRARLRRQTRRRLAGRTAAASACWLEGELAVGLDDGAAGTDGGLTTTTTWILAGAFLEMRRWWWCLAAAACLTMPLRMVGLVQASGSHTQHGLVRGQSGCDCAMHDMVPICTPAEAAYA